MAGIYIHIPFCKKACHYCDFHFSTSLKLKEKVLTAMHQEIALRSGFLEGESVETIYFGGGSPSILDTYEIGYLLASLKKNLSISPVAEITLEANPDDLSKEKLRGLHNAGINRLSIGIQSFRNEDLALMNRAHDEKMARKSLEYAREIGFKNINVDLIYGIPNLSSTYWSQNLLELITFKPEHISAYCLTIEERTAFGKWVKDGKMTVPDDDTTIDQFQRLMAMLHTHGYEQYEISNFCLPGLESKHNASYWKGSAYLGIGPSAHSFNGSKRSWNMKNNPLYVKAIESGAPFSQEEKLSEKDQFNEYVLTSLRTKWGLDLTQIDTSFGPSRLAALLVEADKYLKSDDLYKKKAVLYLTEKGKLVADKITSDLFVL